MRNLLYLVHRIPYPPDKGDKIRSWHFLKFLAQHYRVHLACFMDDPADRAHLARLEALCAGCYIAELEPRLARLRSLAGLLEGAPLTLRYYRDKGLQDWVDGLLTKGEIDNILVFSSAMAQFVMGPAAAGLRRTMDFVDIDSDKWRQYAETRRWPASWIYRRESELLLAYERKVAAAFDASLFVSAAEAQSFRQLDQQSQAKVFHINNGVDHNYFSPEQDFECPYQENLSVIVFTGAMDYWPNEDAVTWFSKEILPRIRKSVPDAQFYIVGARPSAGVQGLADLPGVSVTGRVADVRPYLAHAAAVVAPLRVSRGVQNKVLEGMAMAKAVVSTPQALEGISVDEQDVMIASDSTEFADHTISLLKANDRAAMGRRARQQVVEQYDWAKSLARLDDLLWGGRQVTWG
ncbi:MAG: TIGR03087 family PEP-CTERM/XrtA system glycosyltransferase [Pseudomonadota bacterium]